MDVLETRWAEAMRAERRGDAAAYRRLLREVSVLLRRILRRRLGQFGLSTAETEDIVQEILIGLHTKRYTWDPQRPLMPWLYGIARYKFLDAARKLRREALVSADLTVDDLAEALAALEDDPDRATLDLAPHLDQLPVGQRNVVRALALDGLSTKAAAQRLDLAEGSVRVLFHRALQRLRAVASAGTPHKDKRAKEPS